MGGNFKLITIYVIDNRVTIYCLSNITPITAQVSNVCTLLLETKCSKSLTEENAADDTINEIIDPETISVTSFSWLE